jgi:hypothetical protein
MNFEVPFAPSGFKVGFFDNFLLTFAKNKCYKIMKKTYFFTGALFESI